MPKEHLSLPEGTSLHLDNKPEAKEKKVRLFTVLDNKPTAKDAKIKEK
jgi:hypothetical protein